MALEERVQSTVSTYVGSSQRKQDGDAYLTGRVAYTADLSLPETVHLAIVRSPHAHARIGAIDSAAAKEHPGVLTVLTGDDAAALADPIPHNLDPAGIGGKHADIRCLALGKVVYVGEPVAAVVASTSADARAAAALVQVEYQPLPAVLEAGAALADGAPLLYEDWGTNVMIAGTVGDGDFDEVAATADRVLEDELHIGRSTTAPMETRAYLADWDERAGQLTWYGTTQNPHQQRWVLATALRLEEQRIRVVAPPAGGAFGLKMHGHPEEILVPLLARSLRRPVKWVQTRDECMLASGKEQTHSFRVAFDHDGRVRAIHSVMVADHGAAAAGPGWGMAFVGSLAFPTGYAVPVCRVDYTVTVTNKPPWAGARPFGKEAPALVMERVMDLVAEACELDPLEVRRRNWVRAEQFPFTTPTGLSLDSGDFHGLLDRALERINYDALREEQRAAESSDRPLGIGVGFELLPEGADIPGALVAGFDTTTVRMNPSGQVTVLTGVTSPGGGSETAIAQIVADRLGVDLSQVTVVQGDTAACPYGFGNLSSRATLAGGGSAALAADDIAEKLRAVAAAMLHADAGQIELGHGYATVRDEPEQTLPLPAVAHSAYSLGYILGLGIEPTLESTRTYKPGNIRHLPDEKGHISPFASFPNALHLSVVEVDLETGVIELRRHVVVHDCGTTINPGLVEGQVRGSVVAGLGAVLAEELRYDEAGAPASDGFKTYLLPRAPDIPAIELVHQVTPSPFTPLGAKGAGETGYAGAAAAVANAVNDALRLRGARVHRTPITPSRLLAALEGL
jgi:aerobic carbon-monoxide dehydrogenase large subunit